MLETLHWPCLAAADAAVLFPRLQLEGLADEKIMRAADLTVAFGFASRYFESRRKVKKVWGWLGRLRRCW